MDKGWIGNKIVERSVTPIRTWGENETRQIMKLFNKRFAANHLHDVTNRPHLDYKVQRAYTNHSKVKSIQLNKK